jgi:hypothetical protein
MYEAKMQSHQLIISNTLSLPFKEERAVFYPYSAKTLSGMNHGEEHKSPAGCNLLTPLGFP